MIPPFLVISRGGAHVVRDEQAMHPAIRARFQERRRHHPLWWAINGGVVGACGSYVAVLVAAEPASLAEWTTPSGLMAVVALLTMIFALGQMWNGRMEDRRRITKLEETYVTKERVDGIAETVGRVEDKLDRIIERIHEAQSR